MNLKHEFQELENENKILRQKLKDIENDNKFDNYFDCNQSIMLEIHSETKQIIRANEAAINFYGYPKKEFFQKTIDCLSTLPLNEINTVMNQAVKKNSDFFDFQHKLANGEIKNVEIYASSYNTNNGIHIILTIIDITNRKKTEQKLLESEERLKKLVNSVPDIIC